jgi:dihydroorotate dehydrogenase electron transfer subunit
MSHYLVTEMDVGSKIYVRGPYGKGFREDAKTKGPCVLVGGGTGIAPLLLFAQHLSEKCGMAKEDVWVYLGGRTQHQIYHEENFRKYSSRVVVTTNDGSQGREGFVTQGEEN